MYVCGVWVCYTITYIEENWCYASTIGNGGRYTIQM